MGLVALESLGLCSELAYCRLFLEFLGEPSYRDMEEHFVDNILLTVFLEERFPEDRVVQLGVEGAEEVRVEEDFAAFELLPASVGFCAGD